jgi:hypothetical protein
MRPFGFSGNMTADFQRHHLIPVNVISRRCFAPLFSVIGSVGFDPRNFLSNGMLLPATEKMAEQTGLPLHRGPHARYDQLVAECLGAITDETVPNAIAVYRRISELQGMLRRALQQDASLMLNRNDPRWVSNPLLKLDRDILQLGVAALLA